MVRGGTAQEGLPFEHPGVETIVAAVGNPLATTLRDICPSTVCLLWVANAYKVFVLLKAELPTW